MIWSSAIAFVGLAGIFSVIFPDNEKPEVAKQETAIIEKKAETVAPVKEKKPKPQIFQESEGIVLCSNYFDEAALYEGGKYHLILGKGKTKYNDKDGTATFFVEATIANTFGAKSKKIRVARLI